MSPVRPLRLLVGTLLCVLVLSAARRHDIHSSAGTLRVQGDTAEWELRVFADDLVAAVAAHSGVRVPQDSSLGLPALDAYVRSRTSVTSGGAAPWAFARCGLMRVGETYRLCYRAVGVVRSGDLRVRVALLTERHADQLNVVRVESDGRRRTLILTAARAEATLKGW